MKLFIIFTVKVYFELLMRFFKTNFHGLSCFSQKVPQMPKNIAFFVKKLAEQNYVYLRCVSPKNENIF